MDLIIPSRNKPSGASFPTVPRKVRQWIGQLYPVTSSNSTRVLIRGLKHCNRLENSVKHRIDILESFRPVVRELIDFAVSHYAGQNLPLNSKERNSFSTVTALLQEMAFGYKIIVKDTLSSSIPGTGKHRNLAVLYAMDALDEIALRYLQVYQEIPNDIWQDINALYKIAEDLQIEKYDTLKLKSSGVSAGSIKEMFIRTHLLAISSSSSFRRGQILQLHNFITKNASRVELLNPHTNTISGRDLVGVDLACNAPASNYTFMDPKFSIGFRVFFLDHYLECLDTEISNTPNSVSALYESDVLTQESLIRLKKNHSTQKRLHSRQYFHQAIEFIHGLKEIYATFCYEAPEPSSEKKVEAPELSLSISGVGKQAKSTGRRNPKFDSSLPEKNAWDNVANKGIDIPNPNAPKEETIWTASPVQRGEWFLLNRSLGGLGLIWKGNSSPQLAVGEIVASSDNSEQDSRDWMLGVTCWVRTPDGQTLFSGITHIAKNAKPALIERTKGGHNSITTQTECLFAQLLSDESQSCIITPAYMFHAGEVVIVREGKSINRFRLTKKVDSTGSFALFTTEAIGSSLGREALSEEEVMEFGLSRNSN